MRLVVYGDFNCPFSALASARVAVLEDRGLAEIDWRGVEHAPEIPAAGDVCSDETRTDFAGFIDGSTDGRRR